VEKMRNAYKILVWKIKEERLRRPRKIWEDNIEINTTEIGSRVWTGLNWLWIYSSGSLF
jgi:hypothetical protein